MFEELPSLSPVQFFGVAADCLFSTKKLEKCVPLFLLPSTADLLDEESFASIYACWNFERLSFHVEIHTPFQKVGEGDIRKGDSVEIFLDTRDLKSKGVISRFCHHFVFYPVQIQGFYGREITRFRGEDGHPLCHPEDLSVSPSLGKQSYSLSIEIPASCLTGYDPLQSPRIGFTYRINRPEGGAQHFAASSEEYVLELHPAVWGTLKLREN
jgi:hypothetical protein